MSTFVFDEGHLIMMNEWQDSVDWYWLSSPTPDWANEPIFKDNVWQWDALEFA